MMASAMSAAAVVTVSAKELSMGITKLSGFHPRLKVKIATVYAIETIAETARMFVVKIWIMNLVTSPSVCTPPTTKEGKIA